MTRTITANFSGETVSRRTDAPYTHASRRDGRVRFHTSEAAARRAAGPYGEVASVAGAASAAEATPAKDVWAVFDRAGNEVGRYEADIPPHAIRAARAEGHDAARASRVKA